MPLHSSTFEYLKPTDEQVATMNGLRSAAANYAAAVDQYVPEGPDKTYVLRIIREIAMWVNVAITRLPDGTPRTNALDDHKALLKGTRYEFDIDNGRVRAYADRFKGTSNDEGC